MKAYKFPLYPSREQQVLLWEHSIKLNQLYNHFLELEKKTYDESHKFIPQFDLNNLIVKMKHEDPTRFVGIFSQCLQEVSRRVNFSYYLFFKKVVIHPPKFRSSKFFYNITFPQPSVGYKIDNDVITAFTYGNMRFNKYRDIEGTVKTITISHDDVKNRFYLHIVTDARTMPTKYTGKHIGIDLGTANLVVTSDGEVIRGPNHVKYFDKQIDKLKSRRDKLPKKHSRKYNHLTKVIRRLYDVKNHKTNDSLHKISRDLSNRFDTIMMEDLKLKKMSETPAKGRNKEIRNKCIERFMTYLDYKCKHIVRVNPINTSKTCCICHHKIEDLPLKQRDWTCPNCGFHLHRDRNAALNILHLGRAQLSGIYGRTKPTIDKVDIGIWNDDSILATKELMLRVY